MVRSISRTAVAMIMAVLLFMSGALVGATPAFAAAGDAAARGVVVDLAASVLGIPIVSANATVGSVTAPPTNGTNQQAALSIAAGLGPVLGVAAVGTVDLVAATRGAAASSGTAVITGAGLTVLGLNVLTATDIAATATCPAVGIPTAATTFNNLALFGTPINVLPNTPGITASAAVVLPILGATGASLQANVRRIETVTATTAASTSVLVTLNLAVTVFGLPIIVPVGTVILADASCERPAAAPTATLIVPDVGPVAGGQGVTITGTNFVPGSTTVTFNGVPATDVVVNGTGDALTAVTPAGALGAASVVVSTVSGGAAAPLAYTYVANPVGPLVTNIDPTSGPTGGGTAVTLTGAGLDTTTSVTFGGVPATIVGVPTATTVNVITPPSAVTGPVDVTVITPGPDTTVVNGFSYVAPTITNVSPPQGPTAGGTVVTITGTGLAAATAVTFDGTPGTGLVASPDGTTVTITTPAHVESLVDVVVDLPGIDASRTDGYAFVAPGAPAITSIAPGFGPTSGGTTVTITGTNLATTTAVRFGAVLATIVGVPTATSVTVTTPPSAVAGPVTVTVEAGTGTSPVPDGFIYIAPTIVDINPNQGPAAGGTVVTIIGTGLFTPTAVTFDGTPGTALSATPDGTTVTVTTPAHAAGAVDVVVILPGLDVGVVNGYTYISPLAPAITSIAPNTGPTSGGTQVTLTGVNLAGTTAVTFGGVAGTIVGVPTATTVTVTTPVNAAGLVDVVAVQPGPDVAAPNGFLYVAPTITSVSPSQGPIAGGTLVTLTGTGLAATTAVTFDGTPGILVGVPTDTTVTVTTPAHVAAVVDVVATIPGGDATAPGAYAYLAAGAPTITSVVPNSGPTDGGTLVTITGTAMLGTTAVTFGGVAGTIIGVPTATTVVVTTPPSAAAGLVDIELTAPAGVSTLPNGFTYVGPTLTSITPAQGTVAGGTVVTITGTGLANATSVTFGGTPGTALVTQPAGTSLTVTTPAHALGLVDVVVALPGLDATAVNGFAFVAADAPTITTVAPNTGPTSGGTPVTITGTNLATTTAVTFGGLPATIVGVPTATTVTVTTPVAVAAGPVDVTVTATGASTLPNGFTYVAPTVTGIDPDEGPESGGTSVTITGTNLQGTTAVTFHGVSVPYFVNPAGTQITTASPPGPPGAATVAVTLPGPDPATLIFTYLADGSGATVTDLSPSTVSTGGGTVVTITGTGLNDATGVTFDGEPGTDFSTAPDGTSIEVTAPPRDSTGPATVEIIFPAGSLTAGSVDYVGPTIGSITPNSGPTAGGTVVTINGTGLAGATDVLFDGVPGTGLVVAPDGTSVRVTTPPHADATVDVVVVLPGLDANAPAGFRYVAGAPTIGSVSPPSGPASGGQTVVITGTGFVPGATTVTFNGNPATGVQVVDSTTLIAVTPPGTVGPATVVVTVAGVSSNSLDYTYTDGPPVPPAPTVDSIDPDSGPTGGGTTVTVTGTNLVPGQTSVIICGVLIPAGQVAVNDAGTTATFVTPPCSEGDTEVRLVTPGGVSNSLTFTYDDGGLPITGASVSIALVVGVALLAMGLLIVVALWRRKDRIQ